MAATTPIFALPYPVPTDPADVPADIQALATKLDGLALLAGGELAYAQATADQSFTATTAPTANTVVTAPAVSLNGSTPVLVEFFAASVNPPSTSGGQLYFQLWDGSTDIQRLALIQNVAALVLRLPLYVAVRLTPSSGSHTYSVRAWASGAGAGALATSPVAPISLRVTRI